MRVLKIYCAIQMRKFWNRFALNPAIVLLLDADELFKAKGIANTQDFFGVLLTWCGAKKALPDKNEQ